MKKCCPVKFEFNIKYIFLNIKLLIIDYRKNLINLSRSYLQTRNLKLTKARLPLEECDPNSQDSGYGGGEDRGSRFRFAEPNGLAPRRMSTDFRSPMKSPTHSISPKRKRSNLFQSLSSGYESTDDGFAELVDMESLETEENHMPTGLSDLISGSIVLGSDSENRNEKMELDATTPETPVASRRINFARRSLSVFNRITEEATPSPPSVSKVRSCLFRSPNATCSTSKLCYNDSPREAFDITPNRNFKRPEPPTDESPILVKRSRKCTSLLDVTFKSSPNSSPESNALQRSYSETEAHAIIKSAIHRSTTDADLTGDFSKSCVLPLSIGLHEDLKSISAETLCSLIRGEFKDKVSDFKIVDCRYPYEYEAGHIEGALNLYNKDMIEKFLLDTRTNAPSIEPDHHKRSIIIFHCEFSRERGPKLSRFLRNLDRQKNKEHYPALHYPEIYLLHGGYEMFFNSQKEFCKPQGYRPMKHPDNEADLRQFRSKSKSWQGEKSTRPNNVVKARNLSRVGF